MGRAFPQREGRAVDEHSEIYVGLDVVKAQLWRWLTASDRASELRPSSAGLPLVSEGRLRGNGRRASAPS